MSNIILIGVGIFALIMTIIGFKRGLIKMSFSLVSMLVVLILVNILTPSVKELLRKTPIYTGISSNIEEYVREQISSSTENMTQTGVNAQKKIINELPLPNGVKEALNDNNNEESYENMAVSNFSQYIAISLSDMILGAVTFVLLFIAISILIKILVQILDIIAKLPVIHTFNTVGGAAAGLLESIIIIWIACIVVTLFSSTEWGQVVCKAISENSFLSFIYDNNLIQKLVTGIFTV